MLSSGTSKLQICNHIAITSFLGYQTIAHALKLSLSISHAQKASSNTWSHSDSSAPITGLVILAYSCCLSVPHEVLSKDCLAHLSVPIL